MSHPLDGTRRECPGYGCPGTAIFGTYTLVEGDTSVFMDNASERGPINRSEVKPAWLCNTCGHYFFEKASK